MSKSCFCFITGAYIRIEVSTHPHTLQKHSILPSSPYPYEELSKGQACTCWAFRSRSRPQTRSSARAEGGEQLPTAPACRCWIALPPHMSLPPQLSQLLPTKVTLPIALERDQLLTFLFLALRHALVMLIEVQTCTAHLAQAKNQNSPGLVPACTKVLKWFGLVQHFITRLWRICQTSESHH